MRIHNLSQPQGICMRGIRLLRDVFSLLLVLFLTFPAGSVSSADMKQGGLSADKQAALCVGKSARKPIAIDKSSYPNTASIIKNARAHAESGRYLEALEIYNYADDVVDIEKEPLLKRKILLEKEKIHKVIDQICEQRLQELERQQSQKIKELYAQSISYFHANKLVEAENGYKEILAFDMDQQEAKNYIDNLIPLRAEEIRKQKQRQERGEGVSLPVDARVGQDSAPVRSASDKVSHGIVVKDFRFVGNKSISSADLKTILNGYIGKSSDLDNLYKAADQLSEEYRRRGLDFAKAYIPAQEISNGVVTIAIVEGKLGEIQVTGNRNYSADFIRGFLKKSTTDVALTSERIERGLIILNSEFTDLKVTADLVGSKEPGAVDINAKVEDRFPLHLTLYANNFGQENVSRARFGAQVEWVNALIPGALLTVGGFVGDEVDKISFVNGTYLVPLNYLGTKLGVSGASGSFNVGKDFADLRMYGRQASGSIFVSHPFIKGRTFNLSSSLGFKSADSKIYFMDQVSSYDKTRMLYLEIAGNHAHWGGKSFVSLNYSQGLGDFMGGTQANDPFASRIEASNEFSRFTLALARQQPLGSFFSSLTRLTGQWSDKALLAGEEWQIGGVDSVRGYAPGEGTGDYGYRASQEFRLAPLENKEILQLAAFIDYGYAYRIKPLIGAVNRTELTGAGVGLYSHISSFVAVDLRLDIGWPISPVNNFFHENPVYYFSLTTRF